jgi:serine/threonine protein kinase
MGEDSGKAATPANEPPPSTRPTPAAVPDSVFAPLPDGLAHATTDAPSFPTWGRDSTGLPEAGQRLGDFELSAELGRGAFARVFLARQVSLNREVALKVSANQGEEARALARLEHDSIVRVYDEAVDWERNLRLVWMQYVPGASLEKVIRRLAEQVRVTGSWDGRGLLEAIAAASPREATLDLAGLRDLQRIENSDFVEAVCWLGGRLAEALAHAHGRGVLHRDIKPANILMNHYGRPLLADFNVAVQPPGEDGTPAERIGGTLAYMAPEHLLAFAKQAPAQVVDTRSDIYSLGVVLFELLTGRRPFEDSTSNLVQQGTLQVLAAERRATTPSPRRVCPEIPVALDRVVQRCLAPEPGDRYQSALELTGALDGCTELCRVQKQLPPPGRLSRAVLRHPIVVPVLLVLLPHLIGAAVDLSYNTLWLMASPDGSSLVLPFVALALGYSAIAFVVTGWVAYRMAGPIFAAVGRLQSGESLTTEEVTRVRRWALRTPFWAMVLSGAGWLPGGLLIPWLLSVLVQPVGWEVYLHFGLSFTIAGLIALTYNAQACQFLVIRVAYPRLWADPQAFHATARAELTPLGRQVWLMPLLAGLIPLTAGAAAMVGLVTVDPGHAAAASYLTFQLLILTLIVLGMIGCWLAVSISHRLGQTLTALTGTDLSLTRERK